MPHGWINPSDVEVLADRRTDVDFAIPLESFPRLADQLAPRGGTTKRANATGHVQFGRQGGFATGELEVDAIIPLVCQRCLAPMSWPVTSHTQIALVGKADDAERVPPEFEPVIAVDGRISVLDLVEEELLLGLPVVPLHADPAQCGAPPDEPDDELIETQKPFANLAKLLKRGS